MKKLNTAVGLVGLPNIGKSSLFNAIVGSELAYTANYPFATIKPNVSLVQVPDARLERLAKLAKSKKIIRDTIEVHDIAGLVKGASQGQGLGNEFLGHIRNVDAIIHVVRTFADPSIIHVHGPAFDPVEDIELINLELALADLASIDKRLVKAKGADRTALEEAKDAILNKRPCSFPGLISSKPQLLALISDEPTPSPLAKKVMEYSKAPCVVVCALLESQIAKEANPEARLELMQTFGIDPESTALRRLFGGVSSMLKRSVYFTIGPEEARSWAFAQGERAQDAAGRIHTDIAKGFIMAEVRSDWDAPMRMEGKDYVMQDGDIVHFRFK